MPWYLYSFIAMFALSAMMLIIKKIRDVGFSSMQVNLFLFGFVFLGFFGLNIGSVNKTISSPKFGSFLGFMAIAAVAAIFANLADFKAVGITPNPGYSQAIKNTNILPITILSIFIFGLSFNLFKFLGALLVVIGIIILIFQNQQNAKDKKGKKNKPWYLYSLAAVVCFTVFILMIKKVTMLDFTSKEINLFVFGLSWIGFLLIGAKEIKKTRENEKFLYFLGLVFAASVCSLIANLLDVKAISLAPNPGYAQAIKNTNILLITILSTRFFSSDFTPRRVFGALIILGGIILLVI